MEENSMKYMTVKGEKLSQLGLGTWGMGEKASKREEEIAALRCGLSSGVGVNVIDTAEMYGEGRAESLVGEAIKDLDRSQLFLISKFYPWHASPREQKKSLAASLKWLGTDYLDLYLLHWKSDYPLAETVNANFPGFYNSNHTADRFSASRISFMHDFPETRGSQL